MGYPTYTTTAEGHPHTLRYKTSVFVDGKLFVPLEFSTTIKESEQAAAKVACEALSINVTPEDSGLYKSLLQVIAQKSVLPCPLYTTVGSGLPHSRSFSTTVEVGTCIFVGAAAKTKKQAEINAAKAAYSALTESDQTIEYSTIPPINVFDDGECNIEATPHSKKHQHSQEEDDIPPKRSKCTHESEKVNGDTEALSSSKPNSLPEGPSLKVKPVSEKPIEERPEMLSETMDTSEEKPALWSEIIVYPNQMNLSKPESGTVYDPASNAKPVCELPVEKKPNLCKDMIVYPGKLNLSGSGPVCELPVENKPNLCLEIMVYPSKVNLPAQEPEPARISVSSWENNPLNGPVRTRRD